MTKFFQTIVLMLAIVLMAGCTSSIQYKAGHKDYDYEQLKTYRWASNEKSKLFPNVTQYVEQSGNKVMQGNGFVYQAEGEVDFLLSFDLTVDHELDVNKHEFYGGIGLGFVLKRDQGISTEPYHVVSTEKTATIVGAGTLIIDAIEAKTNQVLWRSVASKDMNIKIDPMSTGPLVDSHRAKESIGRAVKRMLKDFPPKS